MANQAEDCGQVLEQFIHDAANLPAEITHLMEEIASKDRVVEEHRAKIISLDNSLQKFIKQNGSHAHNSREEQYKRNIEDLYARCKVLATEKVALADRAAVVLDRQVKRLDVRIDQMEKEGIMVNEPPLPSLLRNKNPFTKTPFAELVPTTTEVVPPLQATSGNSGSHLNAAQRLNQGVARALQTGAGLGGAGSRISSPSTPSTAALHLQRNQRESSAGAMDSKRRRLNASLGSLPAASSNLRQSSTGPGTPKAGTPSSTRAGSAGPRGAASQVKKPTSKKVAPHQQIRRLKASTAAAANAKPTKRSASAAARLKATGYRKSPAHSASGGNGSGGNAGDEDDSVLSSADVSDSSQVAADEDDIDEDEEEDGAEDTKLYCTCQTVSHGDMVACDNDECPFEWFHWKCVGLTKEPSGTWYCPECRDKVG